MRLQFLSSFIITVAILLIALAILSPDRFNALLSIFKEGYQLLVVLLVIGIIIIIFRKVRET